MMVNAVVRLDRSAIFDIAQHRGGEWRARRGKRSEERRVGKGGRSRWSPYHSKKNNSSHSPTASSDRTARDSETPTTAPAGYCRRKAARERIHTRNINVCTGGWFFFASRRRHTRLQGDWSSDVCSSD